MSALSEWQHTLCQTAPEHWPALLDAHSGLPGPRANLELLSAVAGLADESMAERLLGSDTEYGAACAAAILARRASASNCEDRARALAADERWRVRMGVEIGLQLLGDESLAALQEIAGRWADNLSPLVQRAAIGAICEPRLLRSPEAAAFALALCARTTEHLLALGPAMRKAPNARVLRQALGYCWSVAIAADPMPGLAAFHGLEAHATGANPVDPDLTWILARNRAKRRLAVLLEG